MKLTGIIPQIKADNKIQTRKPERSAAASKDTFSVSQTDRVQLSAGTSEVQKAKEILEQTPVVRADRVEALKAKIASGEYQIDPYKIADKMLINLLSDHLSGE